MPAYYYVSHIHLVRMQPSLGARVILPAQDIGTKSGNQQLRHVTHI